MVAITSLLPSIMSVWYAVTPLGVEAVSPMPVNWTEPKSASVETWLVTVLKGASSIHSADEPGPL